MRIPRNGGLGCSFLSVPKHNSLTQIRRKSSACRDFLGSGKKLDCYLLCLPGQVVRERGAGWGMCRGPDEAVRHVVLGPGYAEIGHGTDLPPLCGRIGDSCLRSLLHEPRGGLRHTPPYWTKPPRDTKTCRRTCLAFHVPPRGWHGIRTEAVCRVAPSAAARPKGRATPLNTYVPSLARTTAPKRKAASARKSGTCQHLRPLAIICQWWATRDSGPRTR